MKKFFVLALAAVMMAAPAEAKKKKQNASPVKTEVRTPAKNGLFNVQFHKDKYYFQIPDSLLGRLLMYNPQNEMFSLKTNQSFKNIKRIVSLRIPF